jgi:NhaA family Na+:H+ antiporter
MVKQVTDMLAKVLKDETISGKLILVATLLALVVVNLPFQALYERVWEHHFSIGWGPWGIDQNLRHWVNEGLMAIFFLVVGLEIKRELVHGELSDMKVAALPIAAALGGMIVPALIYAGFNRSPDVSHGWGIPIATDIAFAVGVVMLLGKRVPLSLKLFLLTLAIADDIGAIIVIALFYANVIHVGYLLASLGLVVGLGVFSNRFAGKLWLFIAMGIVLWVTTHLSGVHASIVGAALGLVAPLKPGSNGVSVAEKLEKVFLPISTFVALPLFAFSSAGVVFSLDAFEGPAAGSVMLGIVLGLVIGKMVGIFGATWLMVRFKQARLPSGTNWVHMVGIGLIAGIGFTVSIFVTELAFRGNEHLLETAKISIFIASAISAIAGSLVLLSAKQVKAGEGSELKVQS